MGSELQKQFFAFQSLVDPQLLATMKQAARERALSFQSADAGARFFARFTRP